MKTSMKRWLALCLSVIMALGLFVPTLAAAPMGEDAVTETPVGEEAHVHTPQLISVGGTVAETPAAAEGEAQLMTGSCTCSPTSPHESGGEATYNPGDDITHYLVYTKGTTFTLHISTTGTLSNASRGDGLSNNGGGLSDTNKTFSVKTDSKTAVGLNTSLSFKIDGVLHTVPIQLVDPNAHVHSWGTGVQTKAPTCGEEGVMTYTCSGCGDTKTEAIAATGEHTWSATQYDTITEPTCTETGLEGKVCTVCGAVSEEAGNTRVISVVEHTYVGDSNICSVCNYDKSSGTTHTHSWSGWTQTKAPSCTATGSQQRTCACGKVETATIAKISHDFTDAGGACTMCGQTEEDVAGNMAAQGGWLESAYIEWPIQSGVARYEVYVKKTSDADYPAVPIDDQLIRRYPGNLMRADALGLKAGAYKMKVVAYDASDNEMPALTLESGQLDVKAHVREGYAFWSESKYKTGSGAYNDDGTLKSNAIVVYVTNDNFDKVQVTVKDSKGKAVTFTGVQDMVDAGVSKTAPGTPLCIRVLGTIDTTGFPSGSWGSSAEGLQVKGSGSYEEMNMTIEGVGNDATFKGFGMLLRNCGNVEVRNLGILNCNDDGISIDTDNCNLWVHNIDFFYGKKGSAADQVKGDGSLDTKGSKQITHSFNHFWDSGKCNLQGMKSEKTENTITYHHNWYDHSDSRHPRIRTCTVHIYNNYFDGNAKYGVGSTMGSSVFVENNYFRSSVAQKPMLISMQGTDIDNSEHKGTFSSEAGGMIKAYNNTFAGGGTVRFVPYSASNNVEFDAYVVANRSDTVPGTVTSKSGGNTYSNFDTASNFYSYTPETPEQAKETVMAYAGRLQGGDFQWTFDNSEDANYAVIDALRAAIEAYAPTLVSVGDAVEGGTSSGPIAVSKVTLNKTSDTIAPEETLQLTATVTPSTATDKSVDWSSSNPAVATVDDDGLVTAVAVGTATITVTTQDGGKTASCTVTVSDGSGDPGISDPGPSSETKKTYTLKVDDFTMSGTSKSEPATASAVEGKTGGYFTVKDTVNLRTKKDSATSGATAQFFEILNDGSGGIQFTVKNAPATATINFSSSAASDTSTMVLKDSSGAIIRDVNNKETTTVTGSNDKAKDVEYTLDAGTYIIYGTQTETSKFHVRLYSVTVTEPKPTVTSVALNKSTLALETGDTDTLTATVNVANDSTGTLAKTVTWTTSNAAVATVDENGLVAAVAAGNATITATSTADTTKKASCTVTVTAPVTTSATLTGTGENGDLTYKYSATGVVTVTDTNSKLTSGDKVLVAFYNGTTFKGAKVITAKDVAAGVVAGCDGIRLFWLNDENAPKSDASEKIELGS